MPDIVLTALNAKYQHSAFGLRYLLANLGALRDRAVMLEFGINQLSTDVLDAILEHNPRIVAIGVYIWNVDQATHLVADLKRVRPELVVILGGPEVSYETDEQEIVRLADYVITGEADLAFASVCSSILAGRPPEEKVIPAGLPPLDDLELPYHLYSNRDLRERVIYVEASRGCPFRCEFCLSSLEIPVRQFALDEFLTAMQSLLDRGACRFKFVDRTFNLNLNVGTAILQFFLDRCRPGLFLHFEMIPDRLPDSLRRLIAQFPPGCLQFEVGIQTFNEAVSELIQRRQNNSKVEQNLRFLREQTGVHVHADLIVGLPGESLDSFAVGFDRLVALNPQEIQVGMLKRLRGTPITRHDATWQMLYSPNAPYEILQNKLLDAATFARLRRFARYWNLVANSGNFLDSTPQLWGSGSPFDGFMKLSDWLFAREGRAHGISLLKLAEYVFQFLVEEQGLPEHAAAQLLWQDYRRGGRTDRPHFLRKFSLEAPKPSPHMPTSSPRRQIRHTRIDG